MCLIPHTGLMIMVITPPTPKFYRSFFQNRFGLHHILSTVLSHGEKTIGNSTPSSPAFDGIGGNPQRMIKEPHDVLVSFLVGMSKCLAKIIVCVGGGLWRDD